MSDTLSFDDIRKGAESLRASSVPQPPLEGEHCPVCHETAVFEVSNIDNNGKTTFTGKRCLYCFTWGEAVTQP